MRRHTNRIVSPLAALSMQTVLLHRCCASAQNILRSIILRVERGVCTILSKPCATMKISLRETVARKIRVNYFPTYEYRESLDRLQYECDTPLLCRSVLRHNHAVARVYRSTANKKVGKWQNSRRCCRAMLYHKLEGSTAVGSSTAVWYYHARVLVVRTYNSPNSRSFGTFNSEIGLRRHHHGRAQQQYHLFFDG